MEIYANGGAVERTATLHVPVTANAGTIEITAVRDNNTLHTFDTVQAVEEGYSVVVPLSLARTDSEFDILWNFTYTEDGQIYEYREYTPVSVVTPILPFSEVRRILGDDATQDEVADVEKAVRHVIQAHTGQFFGRFVGKKSVTGSGDSFLRLPMRLISAVSVNGDSNWSHSLSLRGDGWYLRSKIYGVPSIRADWDGWHESPWGYSGRAPIVAPYSRKVQNFIENAEYVIDGEWGWKFVPAQVQEAAKLLVNDYACADSMYRDRFLTSMTAADWRIQFHDGAFADTGNVRANQLLAQFILRRGWAVV